MPPRSHTRFLQIFLPVIVLSFVPLCAAAQPRAVLPQGKIIELGTLLEMVKTKYDLVVENRGLDSLVIRNVSKSCGCTEATPAKNVIGPGDSTIVHVSFDNKEINGPAVRHVFIATNDTRSATIDVVFRGTVTPVLKPEPRYIDFGTMQIHSHTTRSIDLENTTDDTIHIMSVHGDDVRLIPTVSSNDLPPHTRITVNVGCIAQTSDKLLGRIEITTSSPLKPVVKVSYVGKVVR